MKNYKDTAMAGIAAVAGLAVGYALVRKTAGRKTAYTSENEIVHAMALGTALDAIDQERKGTRTEMSQN